MRGIENFQKSIWYRLVICIVVQQRPRSPVTDEPGDGTLRVEFETDKYRRDVSLEMYNCIIICVMRKGTFHGTASMVAHSCVSPL